MYAYVLHVCWYPCVPKKVSDSVDLELQVFVSHSGKWALVLWKIKQVFLITNSPLQAHHHWMTFLYCPKISRCRFCHTLLVKTVQVIEEGYDPSVVVEDNVQTRMAFLKSSYDKPTTFSCLNVQATLSAFWSWREETSLNHPLRFHSLFWEEKVIAFKIQAILITVPPPS